MTAVATRAPTGPDVVQQLPLVAAAAPPALKLAVVGQLARPAEVRHATDGSTHIHLTLVQPMSGLPLIAVMHVPPGDHVFEGIAHRLQVGHGACLLGRGLQLVQHLGQPTLRLQRCDGFTPHDLSTLLDDPACDQAAHLTPSEARP